MLLRSHAALHHPCTCVYLQFGGPVTYDPCFVYVFAGPGMYDPKHKLKVGNRMVVRDKRFKPIKSEVPGPGAYEVCKYCN